MTTTCTCRIGDRGNQRERIPYIEYCSLHQIAEDLFNELASICDADPSFPVQHYKLADLMSRVKRKTKFV